MIIRRNNFIDYGANEITQICTLHTCTKSKYQLGNVIVSMCEILM